VLASIVSINTSPGGIPKLPLQSVKVSFAGLEGDGHNHEKHRTPFQAVCLQDIEKLRELNHEGYQLAAGTTGENLTVENLHVNALEIGTILRFQNGVVLELTKVRKPCYVLDAISPQLKVDVAGRCGMYAKVLQEGSFSVGEAISISLPQVSSF
jgi:MOSC domain-containing protein YiiM